MKTTTSKHCKPKHNPYQVTTELQMKQLFTNKSSRAAAD